MMRFKTLFPVILSFIVVFFLTSVVSAELVPWSSIEYTASANVVRKRLDDGTIKAEDYQQTIGPPLPAVASAQITYAVDYYARGSSQVGGSSIDISTSVYSCG
jgi:hypothetical protein